MLVKTNVRCIWRKWINLFTEIRLPFKEDTMHQSFQNDREMAYCFIVLGKDRNFPIKGMEG